MNFKFFLALLFIMGGIMPASAQTNVKNWHNPAGGFQNPPGSPQRYATGWDFQKFFWNQMLLVRAPQVPAGHALSVQQSAQGWQTTQGDKLQWLGHSAFRWNIDGITLLSDPLLTNRASPFQWAGPQRFVPSPLKPEEAKADIILITHNHYDHLDLETLKRLPNKNTVQVIVPLGVAPLIKEAGIKNVKELDWFEGTKIGKLEITLVPAIHFSARWRDDRNQTLWGGYVVKGSRQNVYLTGDTTTHPTVFKEIGKRYGPFTYGLVSIGAYEPRSIMVGSHTTPEEAVEIGRQVSASTVVAHHWGAIMLTPEPPFEAPVRFKKAAQQQGYAPQNTWLMKVGETRAL